MRDLHLAHAEALPEVSLEGAEAESEDATQAETEAGTWMGGLMQLSLRLGCSAEC